MTARRLARRNTRDYYIAQPCDTKYIRYRVMTRLQYLKANVLPYRRIVTPEGQTMEGAGYSRGSAE